MQRPVGVVIIAVLEFLGAAGCAVFGLIGLFGMGFLARILEQNGNIPSSMVPVLVGGGIAIGIVCFVFAVLLGFLGWGLLNLRNWARITTLVLAIIGLVFGALGLVFGGLRFGVIAMITGGIRLVINGLIVWYLMRPEIKMAFEVGSLPTVPPTGIAGSPGVAR